MGSDKIYLPKGFLVSPVKVFKHFIKLYRAIYDTCYMNGNWELPLLMVIEIKLGLEADG